MVSGVQGSQSGSVGRQPDETKDRINRGVREANVERGVASESVDGEFATRMVFGSSDKGNVTVDRAVRGFDQELGEIIPFVAGCLLSGVICESDVDGNRRVLGLENQELSGGEVSDDDVVLGLKVATINIQSL